MKNPKILPLIFADTSALVDLSKAEEWNDYRVSPSQESIDAQSLQHVFDQLTQGHTLVITREIFKELFPTHGGRLDLMRDDAGNLTIPQNRHATIQHHDSRVMYGIFSDYARDGKLRCYESAEAMLKAGEADAPRGGIVIVDEGTLGKDLPPNGEKLSEFKQDLFMQHKKSLHVRDSEREYRPHKAQKYFDSGEDTLFALANTVNAYTERKGLPQRFAVFNNDRRLNIAFEKDYKGVEPCLIRSYQLPWALSQLHERTDPVTQVTASAYHHALEAENAERNRTLVTNHQRSWIQVMDGAKWFQGVEQTATEPALQR